MRRLVWPSNFKTYFEQQATFIAPRHAGYQQEVGRIYLLAERGQEQDLDHLLNYLRPWNIEIEGNWMGREWLRLMAMEALCYLAAEKPGVKDYLRGILTSQDAKWHTFDQALRDSWLKLGADPCLPDPYADFVRCIHEVIDCANQVDANANE